MEDSVAFGEDDEFQVEGMKCEERESAEVKTRWVCVGEEGEERGFADIGNGGWDGWNYGRVVGRFYDVRVLIKEKNKFNRVVVFGLYFLYLFCLLLN